jgi:uncharacterized protein
MSDRLNIHTQPAARADRIQDIDILRGLALFGVIFVNVFLFNAPDNSADPYYGQFTDGLNLSILYMRRWFFVDKFYPIFSFLFGLGLAWQIEKALQARDNPFALLVRRLTLLWLFGLAHILLVWENDILLNYAVLGFLALWLSRRSLNILPWLALGFYTLPVVVDVIGHFSVGAPEVATSFDELVRLYTTASYWEILQLRLSNWLANFSHADGLASELERLAFFLLGYYSGRKKYISTFALEARYWFKVFLGCAVIFCAGFLADRIWLTDLSRLDNPAPFLAIQTVVAGGTRFFQVFVYMIGFLLILTRPAVKSAFAPLATVGRMALTGYLAHTIVYSLVFNSYGLKLYGSLAPYQLTILAIGLFLFLIFFSAVWLKHFQYGPFEWAWRSLSYGRILPFVQQKD